MSRRVTLRLGFDGDLHDITAVIPDGEPTPWQWGHRFTIVGTPTPRLDGPAKVTGAARYSYDIRLPGMLYGAILRSPWPHARIRSVDLSRARRLPGVRAAIARDDIVARFAGQEVAAVAAVSSDIAADALGLIAVDYEPLPFVVEMEQAMSAGAPSVYGGGSNLGGPVRKNIGDVDRALKASAATIEAVYTTAVQTQVSLETHGCVASWQGDRLTLWCSTQGIYATRDDVAVLFNLPPGNVRVIAEYLGGGFGSKLSVHAAIVMAITLAHEAGAPVKLMLSRAEEQVATGNRPSSWQQVRLGAGDDGRLTAIDLQEHGSGGIGAGSGSAGPFLSVYRCPNRRTEERNVFINAGPSSPMRAPGWPQGCFALEMAMDEMARKLKLDRLHFRSINNDDPVRAAEFAMGARMFDWSARSAAPKSAGPLKRGIGVAAAGWHTLGVSGPEVIMIAHRDGHIELRCGTQDIGTGTRTILAMVAAEELGVPLDRAAVEVGDTRYPYSVPSGGSMTAPSNTPAVRQAAAHLKQKIFRLAAPMLAAEPSDLVARAGRIGVRFDPSRSVGFDEVCRRMAGDSISAEGERVMNYQGYRRGQAGCQFAEVEVDSETGVVRVTEVVAVHDAGVIIDPLTARSQINGGVLMGVGYALFEDRRLDRQTGLMVNPTMDDYKLVGALDVPEIKVAFVEVANGITNTGVVGIGEAATVASAAAIGCAVADALGAPVRALPMTPDRVLAALGKV